MSHNDEQTGGTRSPSFSLKARIWLVRRISGKKALDDLKEREDKLVMHTVVDTMYKHLQAYVGETLQASVSKLPQEMLAAVIASNVHLTDVQKAQIATILTAPANRTDYLG